MQIAPITALLAARGSYEGRRESSKVCSEVGVLDMWEEHVDATPARVPIDGNELALFRLFLSVARTGSVSRTARELGISIAQGAMSCGT